MTGGRQIHAGTGGSAELKRNSTLDFPSLGQRNSDLKEHQPYVVMPETLALQRLNAVSVAQTEVACGYEPGSCSVPRKSCPAGGLLLSNVWSPRTLLLDLLGLQRIESSSGMRSQTMAPSRAPTAGSKRSSGRHSARLRSRTTRLLWCSRESSRRVMVGASSMERYPLNMSRRSVRFQCLKEIESGARTKKQKVKTARKIGEAPGGAGRQRLRRADAWRLGPVTMHSPPQSRLQHPRGASDPPRFHLRAPDHAARRQAGTRSTRTGRYDPRRYLSRGKMDRTRLAQEKQGTTQGSAREERRDVPRTPSARRAHA